MAIESGTKRILVRAPNWIGDAVLCLSALEALKRLFPASVIDVLTRPHAAPVFVNNPNVGRVIEYDSKGSHRGIKGRVRLSRELKAMGFDLAVLFQNAFDAAFVSYISGIPERVGYARDLRSGLLTMPVKATSEIRKVHQVRYYLHIVDEIARLLGRGPSEEVPPRIYISDEEAGWAAGFLKKNGTGGMIVGAAPGASYGPAKRWPTEFFARSIEWFASRYGATAMLFGGPDDAEIVKEVSVILSDKGIKHLNLAGTVSLRHFMALLTRASLFITNDSGPMHVAAALGVPTVAVFGSTDPALTGPLAESSTVVSIHADCSPCFERECRYGHYRCLKELGPDKVIASGEALMKGGHTGAGGGKA